LFAHLIRRGQEWSVLGEGAIKCWLVTGGEGTISFVCVEKGWGLREIWVGIGGRRKIEFMVGFGVGWDDFFRDCVCLRGWIRLERGRIFRWGISVRVGGLERMGGNLGGGMIIAGGWRVCEIGRDGGMKSQEMISGFGLETGWRKERRDEAWAEISILNILSRDCCATLNSSNHARTRAFGSFLRVGRG